jgi:hypothetical protein
LKMRTRSSENFKTGSTSEPMATNTAAAAHQPCSLSISPQAIPPPRIMVVDTCPPRDFLNCRSSRGGCAFRRSRIQMAPCQGCAKPPLEATVYRLHKHKKADVLPPLKGGIFFLKQ